MKKLIITNLFILTGSILYSQNIHPLFPQDELNKTSQQVSQKSIPTPDANNQKKIANSSSPKSVLGVLKKMEELKITKLKTPTNVNWAQSHDTIFVGVVPHDTLRITGNWHHSGPILVLSDGVLIFKNATVIDSGDVYVFQQGQLLADSSSLTFPQQYFYQRGIIAVQNAYLNFNHCSFNYSGMSHNLVIGGNATVIMNNVHQHDWTTCGLFGKPTLHINGCNQAGEYILSDSSTATFKNTDTLLLWHHFPDTALVNFAFPNGDTVYNYNFNKTVPGINGVEYSVSADSCHNVMWAMMPVNGSDITISNSKIRAIGTWFQHHDTVNVSKLYDNSSYVNFVAPLADRNLHLINTDVQTWSLYVFDKSHIDVDSVQVGEIGTENRASVTATPPFLLDGSGGYFWATDTSAIFSFGATVYSYVRSEKNGIFVLAYGWVPFSAPQAIGSSIMISVQSKTAGDPVAYEAATTWLEKIDGPDTSYTNAQVPVIGSAWIDWGINGSGWMNFASYSVYYQLQGNTTWTRILKDSLIEIRHSTLKSWNTAGLATGNYLVKLTVKNNFGDSVEALKPITLLAGVTAVSHLSLGEGLGVRLFPNPTNGTLSIQLNNYEDTNIEIYNTVGQKVLTQTLENNLTQLNIHNFSDGVYHVRITKNNKLVYRNSVVKE